MSTELFLKGFFVALFSAAFIWATHLRVSLPPKDAEGERQKYLPYMAVFLLPFFVVMLAVLTLFSEGARPAAEITISVCFGIFLHISVYYAVLIPLLPFLRRRISAGACAMLWLIPNYLYILSQSYASVPRPLFVIRAPGELVRMLFFVWVLGAAAVLVWKTATHLVFRVRILREAWDASDAEMLKIWDAEIKSARIKKPKFRLVISKHVSAPLTVGLVRGLTRVVLPEREYSTEELSLIFRHEIVHIGREDAWAKFFLVFCTAMCWFNPLMWIAMRKSADDIELSCDETVLLESDTALRRRYAELILKEAGDERGFTTCLSASASALRYRLKNIMSHRKRRSGALTVGIVFFVLCMTCGYVALAYGEMTGAEMIYNSEDMADYTLRSITMKDNEYNTVFVCTDEAAFHEYMSGLELTRLTGNYSFSENEKQFTFMYYTPKGALAVVLSDETLKCVPLYSGGGSEQYYLPDGADWEYLDTIIIEYPALNVRLFEADDDYGSEVSATLWGVLKDGEAEYGTEYEPGGIFSSEPRWQRAELSFSHEPVSGCTVTVERWGGGEAYSITPEEIDGVLTFSVPEHTAHYTVTAEFPGRDGGIYEAEFKFDIGNS